MVNSKSVKILKNVRLKFVSVILVITTFLCKGYGRFQEKGYRWF